MKDIQKTLMSQYANSPAICAIIEGINECIDPSSAIDSFYDTAWNIYTAKGFGLDIWGRIVGVNRVVRMADPNGEVFGFNTSQKSFYPFNQRPFSSSGSNLAAYRLPDEQYRFLILIKAFANIIDATVLNINKFLKFAFSGRSYCLITASMQTTYVFDFKLSAFERYMIYSFNILPRPCGVKAIFVENF